MLYKIEKSLQVQNCVHWNVKNVTIPNTEITRNSECGWGVLV